MKLLTYELDGKEYVGVLSEDGTKVVKTKYASMLELINSGEVGGLKELQTDDEKAVPLEEVKILAPIPKPDLICVGENYKDHAEEAAHLRAEKPESAKTQYFGKRVNRAVAPGDPIEAHEDIDCKLDYEVELAVVLGKGGRYIKAEEAFDHVFGYTILNDASGRQQQFDFARLFYGKGLDNLAPMGPWIVTEDEFERPPKLRLTTHVNGELRQDSNTELLISGVARLIEELSEGMTLYPGTIISTGTPSGVALAMEPANFLKPGDVVRCEIEGIGVLENPISASADLLK